MKYFLEEFTDFLKYESRFGIRVMAYDLVMINKLYFKEYFVNKALDFCDENNLRLTFFVRSHGLEKKGWLIKRLKKGGHEIASHGYTHVMFENKDKDWIRKDFKLSMKKFEEYKIQVKGFRSPFLSENSILYEVLDEFNFEYSSNRFYNVKKSFDTRKYHVKTDYLAWPSDWHGLVVNRMPASNIIGLWKSEARTILLHPWIFMQHLPKLKGITKGKKDFRIISNEEKNSLKISFDLY